MRSRYTAYATGNLDYVEQTCTAFALKDFDRAEAQQFIDGATWLGLEVLKTEAGGADDAEGKVEYIFRYRFGEQDYVCHELSSFVRQDGRWSYHDCIVNPKGEPARVEKVGRNDPCPCGSGKKHKKCCGS
jgi:SEC-C motif-containing protein